MMTKMTKMGPNYGRKAIIKPFDPNKYITRFITV
jgi:hypothetical protein